MKGIAIDYSIGPARFMIIGTNYRFVILEEVRVVIEIARGLKITLM
jgi:hypothetical protein